MATVTESQNTHRAPRSGVSSALVWIAALALLGVAALGIASMNGQVSTSSSQPDASAGQ